jgi:hypothetical protein
VPDAAWLNLYGLSPEAAAEAVADFTLTPDRMQAFAEAQQSLAALCAPEAHWQEERRALRSRLLATLHKVLNAL